MKLNKQQIKEKFLELGTELAVTNANLRAEKWEWNVMRKAVEDFACTPEAFSLANVINHLENEAQRIVDQIHKLEKKVAV